MSSRLHRHAMGCADDQGSSPRSAQASPGVLRLSFTARCSLACLHGLPDGQEPEGLLTLEQRRRLQPPARHRRRHRLPLPVRRPRSRPRPAALAAAGLPSRSPGRGDSCSAGRTQRPDHPDGELALSPAPTGGCSTRSRRLVHRFPQLRQQSLLITTRLQPAMAELTSLIRAGSDPGRVNEDLRKTTHRLKTLLCPTLTTSSKHD